MEQKRWMLYGAYGYTGRLVTALAVERGYRPILAGRSAARLRPLAEQYMLDWLPLDLDDPDRLAAAVGAVDLVYHAAGPFIHTSQPMIAACLAAGVNYVDITGEIAVFENTFTHDQAARQRGVALISGVGFDVVPTDCLARYVADRLPDATQLEIAIAALGSPSGGTTRTTLEHAPQGGLVRRDGNLTSLPIGQQVRSVRFADKTRTVMPIPWGDLATAYRSTGIPNITTYMAFPARLARAARWVMPVMQRALAFESVRAGAQSLAGQFISGPDEAARQKGRSSLWARASTPDGRAAEAWLETLEGYQFTALASLRCVEKLFELQPVGALTPAQAFGPDLVMEVPGTVRYDQLPQ